MQMKISILGWGVGIPHTGLGIGLGTVCYIAVRESKTARPMGWYIWDAVDLGTDSGNQLVGGGGGTDWFPVNEVNHPWIDEVDTLEGKIVQIDFVGPLPALTGHVDVKISYIDGNNNFRTILHKANIGGDGFQLSATSIRGRLKRFSAADEARLDELEDTPANSVR